MMCCVIRFFVGGLLMALLCAVSQRSASLGGILSALPMFSGAVLFMSMLNSNATAAGLLSQARGGTVGMSIGLVFYLSVIVALDYHCRSWQAFGIGTAVCIALTALTFCVKGYLG